jgi:hypothetical protein
MSQSYEAAIDFTDQYLPRYLKKLCSSKNTLGLQVENPQAFKDPQKPDDKEQRTEMFLFCVR